MRCTYTQRDTVGKKKMKELYIYQYVKKKRLDFKQNIVNGRNAMEINM